MKHKRSNRNRSRRSKRLSKPRKKRRTKRLSKRSKRKRSWRGGSEEPERGLGKMRAALSEAFGKVFGSGAEEEDPRSDVSGAAEMGAGFGSGSGSGAGAAMEQQRKKQDAAFMKMSDEQDKRIIASIKKMDVQKEGQKEDLIVGILDGYCQAKFGSDVIGGRVINSLDAADYRVSEDIDYLRGVLENGETDDENIYLNTLTALNPGQDALGFLDDLMTRGNKKVYRTL